MTQLTNGFERYSAILGRLQRLTSHGKYMKAMCPAHEDVNASLSISIGDNGSLMLKCHAGCAFQSVIDAIGVKQQECFADSGTQAARQQSRIVATYPYCDENGEMLFEVCRFEPKDFRPRRKARPDDSPDSVKRDGWVWNLQATRHVLYRLPELKAAMATRPDRCVFVCEGEKDVDSVRGKLEMVATTNPGGAGKWRDEYTESLRGMNVAIVPDRDPVNPRTGVSPGMEHAEKVACALVGVAKSVKILSYDVEGMEKFDISDWIAARAPAEARTELIAIAKASPLFLAADKREVESRKSHVAQQTNGARVAGLTWTDHSPSPMKAVAAAIASKASYLPPDDFLVVARHLLDVMEQEMRRGHGP